MNLSRDAIEWAIKHLITLSDSDLFPRPIELDIVASLGSDAVTSIQAIDLSSHNPGPSRRFIVPKDDLSYRAATQLDPLDSIILAALIHQHGELIEGLHRPLDERSVFSYRFQLETEGHLWNPNYTWNDFWAECYEKSEDFSYAVTLDISDFYNQIYHHTIENQLIEARLPNQAVKWILRLLESITAKVSRGIPVGPHAAHLLAEASICPIDNSLTARGITFSRFVDDIIVFTNSQVESRTAIFEIADILDKQQRLLLQRQKTKILDRDHFQEYCRGMVEDRPINDIENKILSVIRKYSGGNPYLTVLLSDISDEDLKLFTPDVINTILSDYLSQDEPDYIRLRWFVRRLSQVGHPSAIDFFIDNLESLIPAISEICHYFVSVGNHRATNWLKVGNRLLPLLELDTVKSNEYFQMSIISLFNRKVELDHIDKVLRRYSNSSPTLRREILLTAYANKSADWIRELKEQYPAMDHWSKRAFLLATKTLPLEERKFFLRSIQKDDILFELLTKWAKQP